MMVEWRFDSRNEMDAHRLRHEFMDLLRAGGTGDFPAAELVYGELVGNAIRHAPGRIVVRLDWDDDTPVLAVHDEGESFRPDIRLPDDPMSEHGRGLFIVRALALSLDVENIDGDGSQVCARLPVHRAA
jgi:signal transduction histidine kinase